MTSGVSESDSELEVLNYTQIRVWTRTGAGKLEPADSKPSVSAGYSVYDSSILICVRSPGQWQWPPSLCLPGCVSAYVLEIPRLCYFP